jgi:aryl-alcohol dehydrogenase-like predicted oxidoreductase
MQKRQLGKTGMDVTPFALGGEGILRTYGREREAVQLIHRAIELGVNYLESARAYSGSESYYGKALGRLRQKIFLASKSHGRTRKEALAHLEETLVTMKTDYLDVWQIHDVRTEKDMRAIFGARGALEAFVKAKEQGKTRFIGVTGHHDPSIIKKCLELYHFDTVLIPVNPAEPFYQSFFDQTLPLANQKEIGVVGMKVYSRGIAQRIPNMNSLEPFFRFALSQPIAAAVIGCDSIEQLEENVGFVEKFTLMSESEKESLLEAVLPYARQLTYYKP